MYILLHNDVGSYECRNLLRKKIVLIFPIWPNKISLQERFSTQKACSKKVSTGIKLLCFIFKTGEGRSGCGSQNKL